MTLFRVLLFWTFFEIFSSENFREIFSSENFRQIFLSEIFRRNIFIWHIFSNCFGLIFFKIFPSEILCRRYFRRKYFVEIFSSENFRQISLSEILCRNIFIWNIMSNIFVKTIRQNSFTWNMVSKYFRHKYFVKIVPAYIFCQQYIDKFFLNKLYLNSSALTQSWILSPGIENNRLAEKKAKLRIHFLNCIFQYIISIWCTKIVTKV